MHEVLSIDGQVTVIREADDMPKCVQHDAIECREVRFGLQRLFCSTCGEPLTREEANEIITRIYPNDIH